MKALRDVKEVQDYFPKGVHDPTERETMLHWKQRRVHASKLLSPGEGGASLERAGRLPAGVGACPGRLAGLGG